MEIYKAFNSTSDEKWLDIVNRSITLPVIDGVTFPGFPDPKIQENYTGRRNEKTLVQAFGFYMEIKKFAEQIYRPINSVTKICDFGVGWGRILRFFLKDTLSSNLVGVDPNPKIVQICKDTYGENFRGAFEVIPDVPPYDSLEDGQFDIIYAYSVFSHLKPEVSISILKELQKKLTDNGLVVITSRGKQFMDFCERMRSKPSLTPLNHHMEALKNIFVNNKEEKRLYDAGTPIFYDMGTENYGEAAVPPEYFANQLADYYTLIGFELEGVRQDLDQTVTALRKK